MESRDQPAPKAYRSGRGGSLGIEGECSLPVDISAVPRVAVLPVDLLLAGRGPELVPPLAEVVEERGIPVVPIHRYEGQVLNRAGEGSDDCFNMS